MAKIEPQEDAVRLRGIIIIVSFKLSSRKLSVGIDFMLAFSSYFEFTPMMTILYGCAM